MTFSKNALFLILISAVLGACSFQKSKDRIREFSPMDPGFRIYDNKVSFGRDVAADPLRWTAKLELTVKVCLWRTFDNTVMDKGIHFVAELADTPQGTGKREESKTADAGCFDFETEMSYNYAEKKPMYLRKYIIVSGLKGELEGQTRVKPILIDPWNGKFHDEIDESEHPFKQPADVGPLQLRMQNVVLQKTEQRVSILDRNLDLTLRFPMTVSFFDRYSRKDALNSSVSDQPWVGSRYAITGVLFVPDLKHHKRGEPFTYQRLAGFKSVGTAGVNGSVSADIALEIPFKELPALESRPRIMLEIQPLSLSDQAPEPLRMTFVFDPRPESNTYMSQENDLRTQEVAKVLLKDLDVAADAHVQNLSLMTHPQARPQMDVEARLAKMGFKNLQTYDLDANRYLPNDLSPRLMRENLRGGEINENMLRTFKDLFPAEVSRFPGLEKTSVREEFIKNPKAFVKWARFTVADSVNPEPVDASQKTEIIGVAANLFRQAITNTMNGQGSHITRGDELADVRNYGFNSFGIGQSLNVVVTSRTDNYKMRETNNVNSEISQAGLTRVNNLFSDQIKVVASGTFRDCLLLNFVDAADTQYLFCARRQDPVSESYYYLKNQLNLDDVVMLDAHNMSEMVILKTIRGEQNFKTFTEKLFDHDKTFELIPTSRQADYAEPDGFLDLRFENPAVLLDAELDAQVRKLFAEYTEAPPLTMDQAMVYLEGLAAHSAQLLQTKEQRARFQQMSFILSSTRGASKETYARILKNIHVRAEQKGARDAALYVLQIAHEVQRNE